MAKKKTKQAPASQPAPAEQDRKLAHLAPAIQRFAVAIDTLTPDPQNARTHNERNLESITTSLKRFGQQKPIIFDAGRVVRAGNGTLAAAKTLGWTTIAAIETNLSGPELDAYEIADNRTAELAGWDPAELARQLDALDAVGIEKELLAFTTEEYENILKQIPLDENAAPAPSNEQSGGGSPPSDQYKIIVDCRDEMHQTELLDRFDQEGLKSKALVS